MRKHSAAEEPDSLSEAAGAPATVTRLDSGRVASRASDTQLRDHQDARDLEADRQAPAQPDRDPPDESDPPGRDKPQTIGARTPAWVMSLRVLVPLLVVAAGYGAYNYLVSTRAAQPAVVPQETRFAVTSAPITLQDVKPRIALFGNSVAAREVQLRALVAGRVVETGDGLLDGALVSRDEMLLRIDPFDYQTSIRETEAQRAEAVARRDELEASVAVDEANLTFAREQLQLAVTDLERAERLSVRGNLADRALDERRLLVNQRRQTVTQFENTLRVTRARVRQQEAAIARLDNSLAQARQRLAETTLVAPFDAYVTDVNAQVGRMMSVNDAVATLIDRGAIDVRFTLTDQQYGRLAGNDSGLTGRVVTVVWEVGGSPVKYDARIDRVAARVASDSGGVDVFARVSDPKAQIPLRPGAFVRAELDDVVFVNVASVPSAAVYDRERVFAIVDGRLQARDIEVVGRDGANLLIRGDIKTGDRVLTTRLSTPGTGVAVQEQ